MSHSFNLGRTPDVCKDVTPIETNEEDITTTICQNVIPPPEPLLTRGNSLNTEYSTGDSHQESSDAHSRRSSFHGQICPPPFADMPRSSSFSKNQNDLRNQREETASLRDALHATSPHVKNSQNNIMSNNRGSQSTLPRCKGSQNGISVLGSPQLESPQSRPQQRPLHQLSRQPSRESPSHQSTTTSFTSSSAFTSYNSINGGTTTSFTNTLPSRPSNNSLKGILTRSDTNSSTSSAPSVSTGRPRFPQDYVRQSSDSFKSKQMNNRRKDTNEVRNNKESNGRAGENNDKRTEVSETVR